MNRILKFRAWDKLTNRFIYPNKGYQGHFILDLNGRFHNLQNGSGGDEYIVQQFTGFKDLKGNDIFEGDILELCAPEDFDLHYADVGFEKGEYTLSGCADLAGWVQWSVVKSNIFENPELLKA